MKKNKKDNKENNTIFIIILFAVVIILVLFLPKIYNLIETIKLPEVENKEELKKEDSKEISEEVLETIHYPKMRNSIYDSNTYYSLDKFTISNMSNNDILYNAFLDIYEGNMTSSGNIGRCSNVSKEFSRDYMELRVKNILGKNVNYTLDSFYVPEDSDSNYKGIWEYDSGSLKFIYNGLCESKITNTKYYNLEELIKAEYEKTDIAVYYYVGFAKVVDNNYYIYSDANMTKEINKGTFTNVEDLNNIFKSINKKDKKIYKYIFKNDLCSYNEYCLYEGKWVNEIK